MEDPSGGLRRNPRYLIARCYLFNIPLFIIPHSVFGIVIMYFLRNPNVSKWTCVVTHSHYWILGKNVDLSGSPSGCARRTPLTVVAFGVLSVWWKTSASVSTLFRVVLPHHISSMRP